MPENSFYRPVTPPPGIWERFGLPLLVAIALFLVDLYFIPGIFALSLLLMMLTIFLAFRLPPAIVAFWTVIYASFILIISLTPMNEAVTNPIFRPYVRTALFLVGGSAAILLAGYRQRLELGHEALFRVISSLPLAVIVSDISGNILLLNEQAKQVLKNHIDNLAGLSYFSTFVSPSDQGKTIAKYISYFDASHVGTVSTVLRTRGQPALSLHASITVVGIDKQRYAITVVERVEHVAEN